MAQLLQDEYLGTAIDFSHPINEPALLPPDSLRWRVFKNQTALAIGGIAAVLLEFADPRIRSGVWDHSTYKIDPIGRSKRTGLVALLSCYGPKSTAIQVIGQVNRLHGQVKGATPDGQSYRALDPILLNWVAATASFGFVSAYDRFVEPLSAAEKDQFMREGEAVNRQFGALHTPKSMAEFNSLMHGLEDGFEPHPIIFEFLNIIQSGQAAPSVPRFLHRAIARAAVSLLQPHIRARLNLGREFDLRFADRVMLRLAGRAANRQIDRQSAPCLASERLGLPYDFLYRSRAEQRRLLAARSAIAAQDVKVAG
jgi:uncharacterized protein (DUF2236 family)